MTTKLKIKQSSTSIFPKKRNSASTLSNNEIKPVLPLKIGSINQTKPNNLVKLPANLNCEKHFQKNDSSCKNCGQNVCTFCLFSGEHKSKCSIRRPISLEKPKISILFRNFDCVFSKTLSQIQCAQINTVSDIESKFDNFILQIQQLKNSSIQKVKTHFAIIQKEIEKTKTKVFGFLKTQEINLEVEFAVIEKLIQLKTEKMTNLVVKNSFKLKFEKNKMNSLQSFFKQISSEKLNSEELNLLSFSIEDAEFSLSLDSLNSNLKVYQNYTHENNHYKQKQSQISQRYSIKSQQNSDLTKTEKVGENNPEQRFSNKIQFRSNELTANLPSNNKLFFNSANSQLLTKKINHEIGIFQTPKFIENFTTFNDKPRSFFEQKVSTHELDLSNLRLNFDEILARIAQQTSILGFKVLNISGNLVRDQGLRKILKQTTKLNFQQIICQNIGATELAVDYFVSFRKYNKQIHLIWLQNNLINPNDEVVLRKIKAMASDGVLLIL